MNGLYLLEDPLAQVYDVIVVGSGATGGWAAKQMAEAGLKVALLEAGRAVSPKEFTEHMLSEGIASTRGRYGAYLHRDRVNGMLRARRGSRLAAITSGGAIPENAMYTVIAQPEGTLVGTIDEDFAVESLAGDIMNRGVHRKPFQRFADAKDHASRC